MPARHFWRSGITERWVSHPVGMMTSVGSSNLRFVVAARAISDEARAAGLVVPGFRSPPRLTGVDRSLRHRPGASPAVAVRVRGRPMDTVVADMVEGVLVANGLRDRDDLRAKLLAAVAA